MSAWGTGVARPTFHTSSNRNAPLLGFGGLPHRVASKLPRPDSPPLPPPAGFGAAADDDGELVRQLARPPVPLQPRQAARRGAGKGASKKLAQLQETVGHLLEDANSSLQLDAQHGESLNELYEQLAALKAAFFALEDAHREELDGLRAEVEATRDVMARLAEAAKPKKRQQRHFEIGAQSAVHSRRAGKEEEVAATKIQAAHRGNKARRSMGGSGGGSDVHGVEQKVAEVAHEERQFEQEMRVAVQQLREELGAADSRWGGAPDDGEMHERIRQFGTEMESIAAQRAAKVDAELLGLKQTQERQQRVTDERIDGIARQFEARLALLESPAIASRRAEAATPSPPPQAPQPVQQGHAEWLVARELPS